MLSDSVFTQHYDVIVVGGGPAGSLAAQYAARGGAKVILIERDSVIGLPVRCGEGVSERGIKPYVSLKGPWIVNKPDRVEFIAPDGKKVEFTTNLIGYILDRSRFDKLLGDKAERAGATIVTGADATNLLADNGRMSGVEIQRHGRQYEVYGKIIIGADGVESKVGRWAGMKTMTKFNNMETGVQIRATNININPHKCQFYFGKETAPGGYLWVFPKNEHEANIGVGISGNYSRRKPAQVYLEKFMNRHFPHAEWSAIIAGGIPCNPPLRNLYSKNVMLAGDAGHQVNPLTGAGIANAMHAGRLAGETAGEFLRTKDAPESSLDTYTKRWYRSRGRFHKECMRLKNVVMKFDDEDFNELVRLVHAIPRKEWSILKIFIFAVRHNPELLIDAIKVFRKFQ